MIYYIRKFGGIMKKISSENLNYLLIGILGTMIIIGLILIIFWKVPNFSLKNHQSSNNSESGTEVSSSPTPNVSTSVPTATPPSTVPDLPITPIPTIPSSTILPPTSNSPEESNSSLSEIGVVQYFEQRYQEVETSTSEDVSFQEKAKNAFTTIVDFIFYDKEVNGYTFHELTDSMKLKVISLALKIDNSIDRHFPNYKDKIKDKYSSFKGKIAVKYLEITESLCESVGIDTCNQAKDDFDTMKNSFGFTWSLLKELASSGKEKISNFYLNWRNS